MDRPVERTDRRPVGERIAVGGGTGRPWKPRYAAVCRRVFRQIYFTLGNHSPGQSHRFHRFAWDGLAKTTSFRAAVLLLRCYLFRNLD